MAPIEHIHSVFFRQSDPRWGTLPYYFDDVAHCGCGLCAFTEAVDILTSASLDPGDVYRARAAYGVDQISDTRGICTRDAHEEFNPMNRELFGVESEFLEEVSVESFRRVLEGGDAVIWCSSRQYGEPWIWADGSKQESQHPLGHLVVVWKYQDGRFLLKDSSGPRRLGNDIPYDEGQFARWLAGVRENRYILRAAAPR